MAGGPKEVDRCHPAEDAVDGRNGRLFAEIKDPVADLWCRVLCAEGSVGGAHSNAARPWFCVPLGVISSP